MRQTMLGLALAVLLIGGAAPAAAQETASASLCLMVEVPAEVTSVDAQTATDMISSGQMRITDVVPCDGGISAPPRSPHTDSTEVEGDFIGTWFVSAMRSGETDGTTAIAGMNATEGVSSAGEPVTLAVRCHDGAIDMLVTWGDVLEDEEPNTVFEFDSGRTESHAMPRSTDHAATFFPEDLVETFLRSLGGESTLVASVDREGADPLQAVFDIRQTDEALMNVWAACGPAF